MAAPAETVIDAETLMQRLHAAGKTLACMPKQSVQMKYRPPMPNQQDIALMTEAFGWISLITDPAHRGIVAARSAVNPITGLHSLSWRRIGQAIGCDHKTVQAWHAKAIDALVIAINARQDKREAA